LHFFLFILYFYTFVWLANTWLTDPVYSHGVLIPIVSLFTTWKNVKTKATGIAAADACIDDCCRHIADFASPILLVYTGFLEKMVFGSLLQRTFTEAMGARNFCCVCHLQHSSSWKLMA
jgi:hypothetical protein